MKELKDIKSPISLKAYSRSKGCKFFDTYSVHFYKEFRHYIMKCVNDTIYFICECWNPKVKRCGHVFSLLSMDINGNITIEQNDKNINDIKEYYGKISKNSVQV